MYDGASLGYTEGCQQIARDFEMHQPSVNKWSVPILLRKSQSLDNTPPNITNNNIESDKKYEPCVQFISGTPIVNPDSRSSRSNSITSSGSNTPYGKSGKDSPLRKGSLSKFDPCVSFVGGKPKVNNDSPTENDTGVPAQKLKTALHREATKKGYSIGTRLAPKMIAGVSKPGAVSNIAELFSSGQLEDLQSSSLRKNSACSVLRDDFLKSSRFKQESTSKENKMNFNLTVNVDKNKVNVDKNKREKKNDTTEPKKKIVKDRNNSRRGNLSSLTSQATLVQSQTIEAHNKPGVSALVSNTIFLNGTCNDYDIKINVTGPSSNNKTRNLLGRKESFVSSAENSEDDVESADENELNNWTGRRTSYLQATADKKAEKTAGRVDATMEADDEDSDVNVRLII